MSVQRSQIAHLHKHLLCCRGWLVLDGIDYSFWGELLTSMGYALTSKRELLEAQMSSEVGQGLHCGHTFICEYAP
jgi:hypothetical protein